MCIPKSAIPWRFQRKTEAAYGQDAARHQKSRIALRSEVYVFKDQTGSEYEYGPKIVAKQPEARILAYEQQNAGRDENYAEYVLAFQLHPP